MIHPSLLFLHGHSRPQPTTTSLTISHPHDLALLSRPHRAGHTPPRTCIAKFGYLAKSGANTSYEPIEFDKVTSVDDDTMLISDPNHNFSDFSEKHTRESHNV